MDIKTIMEYFHNLMKIRRLADNTVTNYCLWAQKFLEYSSANGITSLYDIDTPFVHRYLTSIAETKSSSTYNICVSALRYLLRGIAGLSISDEALPYARRTKNSWLPFTDDQVIELVANCTSPRLKLFILLGYDCGLRSEEVVRLHFRDFNKKDQLMTIESSKRYKARTIPYSKITRKALIDYCHSRADLDTSSNAFLFPAGKKKKSEEHLSKNVLDQEFKEYLQTFSFYIPGKHVFHSLRHSYATALAKMHCDIYDIADLMGHNSLATTSSYLHLGKHPRQKNINPCDSWLEDKNGR